MNYFLVELVIVKRIYTRNKGATDKLVFELTRVCVRLMEPDTGSPRRLGLSVAPSLAQLVVSGHSCTGTIRIFILSPLPCPSFPRSHNIIRLAQTFHGVGGVGGGADFGGVL